MPAYVATNSWLYTGTGPATPPLLDLGAGTITDGNDDIWTVGEAVTDNAGIFSGGSATYLGTVNVNGTDYPAFDDGGTVVIAFDDPTDAASTPNPLGTPVSQPFTACFGAGTLIAAPKGEIRVEDLKIGGTIFKANGGGGSATVKWIGLQKVRKLFSGAHMQPVRIRAGAFGDGLPHSDLTVTGDHGMILDGLVINASALVNGGSIDWVPMAELPDRVTYYHIETEAHDVILANGAPAETFVDIPGRMAFDNYAEYLELYGAERIIPEMDRPRITSSRLLPDATRARLGLEAESADFEILKSA